MYINNNIQLNHTEQLQKSLPSTDKSTTQQTKGSIDKVEISLSGRNAEVKWQEIAQKYDVNNISGREVMMMAKELYDNKLISEESSLLMYVPLSIDENLDKKSNYLDLMVKDLQRAKESGSSIAQINFSEKRIDILEQLDKLFT